LYNERPYLEETLQSLARQRADFKVLIVDNASDDGSREVCEAIAAGDDRFVYFRQSENIGAARNFAFSLDASSSEYFMWCGAHDVLSDNFLAAMTSVLDEAPTVALAFGSRVAIDESSNTIEDMRQDDAYVYRFSSSRLVRYAQAACALSDCTIVNGVFRRSHLDGFEFRAVKSCDMVLLSHLLYFGELRYDMSAIYFRRYFTVRNTTQAERISGNANAAGMDDRSLADYFQTDIRVLASSSTSLTDRFGFRLVSKLVGVRHVRPIGRYIRLLTRLEVQPLRTLMSLLQS
jgi:glycosyltransferase involved in cell wall biosynthesis